MQTATHSAAALRRPFKRHTERGDCAPLHPGEVLREDFLPYHRLTSVELARRLGIEHAAINDLLCERAPVTAELAAELAAVFALPARYFTALQLQFDLWHAMSAPAPHA